jgi:integrase
MTLGEGLTWPGSIRTVGKGNKTHVVPLHPDLRELVVSFILANHTDMAPRSFLLSYRRVPALGAEMIERRTQAWGEAARVLSCPRFHRARTPRLQNRILPQGAGKPGGVSEDLGRSRND